MSQTDRKNQKNQQKAIMDIKQRLSTEEPTTISDLQEICEENGISLIQFDMDEAMRDITDLPEEGDTPKELKKVNRASEETYPKSSGTSLKAKSLKPTLISLKSNKEDTVNVFCPDEAAHMIETGIGIKNDPRKIFQDFIMKSGFERSFGKANLQHFELLKDLRSRFPNFSEVIDYFEEQIALSLLSKNKAIKIRPILLLGEPGLGKTRFTREIAKILSLPFEYLDCGSASGSFLITGSDSTWQNGKPGRLFTTLMNHEVINPILMLDEIDKANGGNQFPIHEALHGVLEPETARNFKDEYFRLTIDASHVIWIATANNAQTIPDSLISRLAVFTIKPPSVSDMPNIIRSVYRDILNDAADFWGPSFNPELDDDICNHLGSYTPRETYKILTDSLGKAASKLIIKHQGPLKEPYRLTLDDLEIEHSKKTKNPIGFVPSSSSQKRSKSPGA